MLGCGVVEEDLLWYLTRPTSPAYPVRPGAPEKASTVSILYYCLAMMLQGQYRIDGLPPRIELFADGRYRTRTHIGPMDRQLRVAMREPAACASSSYVCIVQVLFHVCVGPTAVSDGVNRIVEHGREPSDGKQPSQ